MYLSLLQAWNKYSVVVVNPIIACTPQSIVQNTLDFSVYLAQQGVQIKINFEGALKAMPLKLIFLQP